MGLDIRAVSQAVRLPYLERSDRQYVTITPEELNAYPAQSDGLLPGHYRVQQHLRFTAAPGYDGTYNELVEMLAAIGPGATVEAVEANPAAFAGAPFIELIAFSDHMGVIGPQTSRKLAADFARHLEWVPPEWHALYAQFYQAFTLAADAGFVQFC